MGTRKNTQITTVEDIRKNCPLDLSVGRVWLVLIITAAATLASGP